MAVLAKCVERFRDTLALAVCGLSDAHQIARGIEILFQSAVKGAPHSGANQARQVDIGCLDDDRFILHPPLRCL